MSNVQSVCEKNFGGGAMFSLDRSFNAVEEMLDAIAKIAKSNSIQRMVMGAPKVALEKPVNKLVRLAKAELKGFEPGDQESIFKVEHRVLLDIIAESLGELYETSSLNKEERTQVGDLQDSFRAPRSDKGIEYRILGDAPTDNPGEERGRESHWVKRQ